MLFGIIIATIILLLFIKIKKSFNYFQDRGLPYLKPTWIDTLKSFILADFNAIPPKIYEKYKNSGKQIIGYFHTGCCPSIIVLDPELVESILIKDFSSFQDHGFEQDQFLDPLVGHLFNMKGDQWRTLRHKLLPAFTSGKLKGMMSLIDECCQLQIQEMKSKPEYTRDVNMKQLFKRFSLNVTAKIAFGIDPVNIQDPDCEFQRAMRRALEPNYIDLMKIVFFFLSPKLTSLFKIRFYPKFVNDCFYNLTKDVLSLRKTSGVKRNDFIQILLELKEKGKIQVDTKDLEEDEMETLKKIQDESSDSKLEMTDGLLAAQVFIFLLAGFENISWTISVTCYCLSKHPDIQKRVKDEIHAMKKSKADVDYNAIRDMKLLSACVDEALRLYTTTFLLPRECNKTYILPDGKKIDKGTSMIIPARGLHYDDRYWSNPTEFHPDRFLNGHPIKPGTYLPFGDGPRICIAQRLGLLLSKAMLVKIIENFEIHPSNKTVEPVEMEILFSGDFKGGALANFELLDAKI